VHEYSIVQALLEQVDQHARAQGASRVHRLHVRIGELSGVEVPLLSLAYATFRERTLCAGADLLVQPVAARWRCPGCDRAIRHGNVLRCPDCARPARLTEGDEIVLDRIELEVEDV
jgi:hydrogenase nickel incorporation protein HypA/HybF